MINIKEIKYEINPVEYNPTPDDWNWEPDKVKAWFGLSELDSVPSLFIEFQDGIAAIPIEDIKQLLNLPAAQLLDTDLSKTTQG
jgi:hypothetical protein